MAATLCVFSSVAGERGRKPVIIYGAAKAGLTRYLEGLDHKHRADGLRVITVKPGFVKTSMTARSAAASLRGRARRSGAACARCDRPRRAGRLRACAVAPHHGRDSSIAARDHASHQFLIVDVMKSPMSGRVAR